MPPNPLLSPQPSAVVLSGDWDANTGRACEVLRLASSRGIRVVLQLGDFGFAAENGWGEVFLAAVSRRCVQEDVDVFFVDGNHEDFPELLCLPIDRETGLRQVARRVYHYRGRCGGCGMARPGWHWAAPTRWIGATAAKVSRGGPTSI